MKVYSEDDSNKYFFETHSCDSLIKAMYFSVITLIKLNNASKDYLSKSSLGVGDSYKNNEGFLGLRNYINNILFNSYLIGQENKTTTPERNFAKWESDNKITDNTIRVIFETFEPIIKGAFNAGWRGKRCF